MSSTDRGDYTEDLLRTRRRNAVRVTMGVVLVLLTAAIFKWDVVSSFLSQHHIG